MKRKQLLHKSMAVLTALTLMATAFTGCGSGSATKQDDSAAEHRCRKPEC